MCGAIVRITFAQSRRTMRAVAVAAAAAAADELDALDVGAARRTRTGPRRRDENALRSRL